MEQLSQLFIRLISGISPVIKGFKNSLKEIRKYKGNKYHPAD